MSFVPEEILKSLAEISPETADQQDFGMVKVDDEGTVQLYNKWESELAGYEPSQAIGRNFFTQVAPCTNNRLVWGKFQEGVSEGELDHQLSYTFTYKMEPRPVRMHLYRDPDSGSNWVFVGTR